MKEFNLILDKVSQALGITVDNVVKLYPQLRTEYSWFYTCDMLQTIFGAALIVILVIGGFVSIEPLIDDFADEEDIKRSLMIFKFTIILLVILAVLFLIVTVIKGFMCPDIMIIKEFLN